MISTLMLPADFLAAVDEAITHYPVSKRSASLPLLHFGRKHSASFPTKRRVDRCRSWSWSRSTFSSWSRSTRCSAASLLAARISASAARSPARWLARMHCGTKSHGVRHFTHCRTATWRPRAQQQPSRQQSRSSQPSRGQQRRSLLSRVRGVPRELRHRAGRDARRRFSRKRHARKHERDELDSSDSSAMQPKPRPVHPREKRHRFSRTSTATAGRMTSRLLPPQRRLRRAEARRSRCSPPIS